MLRRPCAVITLLILLVPGAARALTPDALRAVCPENGGWRATAQ